MERYDEAIEYFDKALAVEPDKVRALSGKGTALRNLGNYTEAIEYYDRALAVEPDYRPALYGKRLALGNLE